MDDLRKIIINRKRRIFALQKKIFLQELYSKLPYDTIFRHICASGSRYGTCALKI